MGTVPKTLRSREFDVFLKHWEELIKQSRALASAKTARKRKWVHVDPKVKIEAVDPKLEDEVAESRVNVEEDMDAVSHMNE
jgi:hypothetical protein